MGDRVEADWAGRPSLSLDDAAEFVRNQREVTEAHELAWHRHQDDNAAWLAARAEAGHAAGQKAVAKYRHSGVLSSERHDAYVEAYCRAVLKWQRKHPRPTWPGVGPTLSDAVLITEADAPVSMTDTGDEVWGEVPA